MTIAAALETRIGRSPGAVFAELAALDRYPQWMVATGVIRVDSEPGPLHEGTRIQVTQRVAGRETVLEGRITALEPNRRLALEGRDRDGITVEIDAELAPDETATVLRWSIRVGLPMRYRMFEGMVRPQAQRAAALDLEAFKRRLESVTET